MKKRLSLRLPREVWQIIAGGLLLLAGVLTERLGAPGSAVLAVYLVALAVSGCTVWLDALRGILRRDLLDEKFLMTIASVGAFIIGSYAEGVAVMLFFLAGEYFEHRAVARSRKSIRGLMDLRPDRAIRLSDDAEEEIDADDLAIGETVVIRPGDRVPVDCTVLDGTALIDVSALTGESVPVETTPGSALASGTVCLNGRLIARVDRVADESAASRVLSLVEDANEAKSRQENFITRFSRVYTPSVVLAAVLLGVGVPLILLWTGNAPGWTDWLHRALTFLVVSCPCALVISVPLSFFGGIGGAASEGILFKGGNRMNALSHVKTVCCDKTGTLTEGKFEVRATAPADGITNDYLIARAASAERNSTHPIAAAIRALAPDAQAPTSVEERAGRGIVAAVDGHRVLVGSKKLLAEEGVFVSDGATGSVFVSEDGKWIGCITVGDAVRAESRDTVARLRRLGVRRIGMLTGDAPENAAPVAKALSLDFVRASLLPDGKYKAVEELIGEKNGSVLYVGDGINDAPVIALADIGVAMGGVGSDAAIEAADLVIMSDKLDRLPKAIRIARRTVAIARQNIVFALAVKLAILILSATGINTSMWLAVFADVGVAVIAILNAMRALRVKNL
ncbi:MAG: cadmium-translocating P-type ATPase [Clostridia bacterium]|nr:cadmium-translocating P-type ATPase [Clostridia bacterium]